MPAYVVFCLQDVSDPAALAEYRAAGRAVMPADMTFLAGPKLNRTLEGKPLDSVVLLQFPTTQAAEAWYHSDAYQAIIGQRLNATTGLAFIVEGR